MIYLSGHIRESLLGIGFLCTPNSETLPPPGRVWAADNGRFNAPEKYSDGKYLAWLARFSPAECLFATAPDIVGNHALTMDLALPMLPRIRALGFKVGLVAQDGWVPVDWDGFDCLFIGGTTAFKLGPKVPPLVAEARARGKWVHMGRVNSFKRMRVAHAIGCQSVDGTFLRFGPDRRAPELASWVRRINEQPVFPVV